MNERFIQFSTQNVDNGKINNGIHDMQDREWYYTSDEVTAIKLCNLLNTFEEENNELKSQREELFIRERNTKNELRELKERNNRQAKQLDNIYTLIEKQEWKTLKGIIQEFQECEEQLKREGSCFMDDCE